MISWGHYFGYMEAKHHGGSQGERTESGAGGPNVPIKQNKQKIKAFLIFVITFIHLYFVYVYVCRFVHAIAGM